MQPREHSIAIRSDDSGFRQAVEAAGRLRGAGFESYLVGGAVRDHILGIPAKDHDVATSARPEEVLRQFPGSRLVGAKFGVALIVGEEAQTEVATFRREGPYLDHRHPSEVDFACPAEDAQRRDFTINALFYDPSRETILDYVGGWEDLRERRLRAIGNPAARFAEDALRLLRAVRFAVRFELTLEERTAAAIRAHAGLLQSISAERVRDELLAILQGPRPGAALHMMADLMILRVILPEVEAMRGVGQPPEFHPEGDVFTHTGLCLDAMGETPGPELAMAVLLHDVGKPPAFDPAPGRIRFPGHAELGAEMAGAILQRLRFPNGQRGRIGELVKSHMRFMHVRDMRQSTLRRFISKPGFEDDLALHRADCLGSHRNLDNYEFCREKIEEFRARDEPPLPAAWITGDDLIALGMSPGPALGRLKQKLHDMQLEGALRDRDKALEAARKLVGEEKRQ